MSSLPIEEHCVGFEVLAAVVMKSTVFWDITLSVESQQTFLRNMLPPSSESENKPGKKPARRRWQADPEDGGDMFLRNVG
jgi:hypothetical protein